MDFKFLKQIFLRCKKHYLKMMTLGIGVMLLACIAFLLLYLDYSLELVFIILIFFGVLPLFLSYELVCSRILMNMDVNYNEIYKNYKAYFAPVFRGCYKVLIAILFSFLTFEILNSIFFTLNYDVANLDTSYIDYQEIYNQMNIIMETESYRYFLIFSLGISFLVFLYNILSKMMIPYFNFFLGIPSMASRKIVKNLKIDKNLKFKIQSRTNVIFMLFIYLISYFASNYLLFFITKNIDLAIIFGFVISLFLSAFFIPFYVTGCYELFYNYKDKSLIKIKGMLEKDLETVLNDARLNEEQKRKIKEGLDSFKQKINDASDKDEENDKK